MSYRKLAVLALALAVWPQHADACEPNYFIGKTWPAGSELPANAFAVFSGNFPGGSKFFTVLVDDQPVEFIVSKHLSDAVPPFAQKALRPLVPPPIGGTWSVIFEEDGGDEVFTFTVTAPDETPPAFAPEGLHFNVNDFAGSVCDSCGNLAVDYWPHFVSGVQDGGAPLVHALYVGHPGANDDQLALVRRVDSQAPFRETVGDGWFADDLPVTEGMCFTLRLLDLAGNEAATALRTCKPCHARIDPVQEKCAGFAPPFVEPAWTEADLLPGGACEAEPALPLPPEQLPEPEPDTTTGETSASETSTGEMATGETGGAETGVGETGVGETGARETTTGEPGTGSTNSSSPTASTSSEEPVPTTSGASTPGPTTMDSSAAATSEGSGEGGGDSAGETPDKVGCGCNGGRSSPWGLALLALAGRRRRARRG